MKPHIKNFFSDFGSDNSFYIFHHACPKYATLRNSFDCRKQLISHSVWLFCFSVRFWDIVRWNVR